MEDWLKIDNDTQVIDTSDIVITAGYNAKFEKIEKKILNHNKYITNNDFNQIKTNQNKQNQQQLVLKMLNNMLPEMKKKQETLQTFYLSFLFVKILLVKMLLKNIFVYQPTFNTLDLKEQNDSEQLIGWKSKGVYTGNLISLYTAFLRKEVLHTKQEHNSMGALQLQN